MNELLTSLGLLTAYSAVGVLLFVLGFVILDLLTPGQLTKVIASGGAGAAALASGQLLGIAAIITFAMMGQDATADGLLAASIVSLFGVLTQALGSWVIRSAFGRVGAVDLRAVLTSTTLTPSAVFLAVAAFGLGVVIAVAVH